MKKMTVNTWIWIFLCMGCFSGGYWLHAALHERQYASQAKADFIRSVGWAVDHGLFSINEEKLKELEQR